MDTKTQEAFAGLNAEEQAEIIGRVEDVTSQAILAEVEKLKAKKAYNRRHELLNQYIAEVEQSGAVGKHWIIKKIQEGYKAQGLDFGKIDFSSNSQGKITARFIGE